MANQPIKLEGSERLASTLAAFARNLDDMPAANAAAGQVVMNAARAAAPRRSGALAGSVRATTEHGAAVITAGSPGVPYARVIHNGWAAHHIRAQPFLTSAAERTQGAWVNAYATQVNRLLKNVKGQ